MRWLKVKNSENDDKAQDIDPRMWLSSPHGICQLHRQGRWRRCGRRKDARFPYLLSHASSIDRPSLCRTCDIYRRATAMDVEGRANERRRMECRRSFTSSTLLRTDSIGLLVAAAAENVS
uniref:Uncharacterized protein n=1 Tax=Steinernema glaseri TaxID=37863 RepID=A0A1I8A2X4_9BILA